MLFGPRGAGRGRTRVLGSGSVGQMSFFSADAQPRALTDLEGVLCARGQISWFGRGSAARLGIVLGAEPAPDEPADPDRPEEAGEPGEAGEAGEPAEAEEPEEPGATAPPDPFAPWRAHALRCAFTARGVPADLDRSPDGRPVLRSAFRADLVPLAAAWTRGAVKSVPAGFELDGPRLRLWVLAAGRRAGRAYLLGLDPHASWTHAPLLAASLRAGLGASLGGDRAEPVLRIPGVRRRARPAELVGERPRGVDDAVWPG